MEPEEQRERRLAKVIAKAWADDEFKARLVGEPVRTLREEGVDIPGDVEIRVVEDTAEVRHFLLPEKPRDEELWVEEMAGITSLSRNCNSAPPPISLCICVLCTRCNP
jgi:hypothetical protein